MKAFIEAIRLFAENIKHRCVERVNRPTYTYVRAMDELDQTLPKRGYDVRSENRCLSMQSKFIWEA